MPLWEAVAFVAVFLVAVIIPFSSCEIVSIKDIVELLALGLDIGFCLNLNDAAPTGFHPAPPLQ